MASLLQRLLRRQSANSIISAFSKSRPTLIPPVVTHFHQWPHLGETKQFCPNSRVTDSIPPHSTPIFPSFPFGLFLNPISSFGLPSDTDGEGQTIWADSVKRKRKKKMNKHKYRKLRKRLQKQG
ncbi:hypothetical protein NMG60_11026656 [Bertholletia excelsa]